MALGPALAIVLPLFLGHWADRSTSKNRVLGYLTAAGAVTALIFPLHSEFWYLFGVTLALAAFRSAQLPLSESILLEGLEARGKSYGPVRLAGTLSFALVSLLAGWLMGIHAWWTFGLATVVAFAQLGTISGLPLVPGHQASGPKVPLKTLRTVPGFVPLLLVTMGANIGLGFYNNAFSLYFLRLGGSEAGVGLFLFLAAASELPFLLNADRVLAWIGPRRAVVFALGVMAFRFLVMTVVPSAPWMLALALVNGLTYIILAYTLATWTSRTVPKELRASGQTLVGVANSVGVVLGSIVGGWSAQTLGWRPTFAAFALFCLTVGLVFWYAARTKLAHPNGSPPS